MILLIIVSGFSKGGSYFRIEDIVEDHGVRNNIASLNLEDVVITSYEVVETVQA